MLTNVTIRKQEGYSPCNTSVHNTSGTIFFLKKLRNKCIIRFGKKWTHDETHFIKPTEEEEEEKEDFFHII